MTMTLVCLQQRGTNRNKAGQTLKAPGRRRDPRSRQKQGSRGPYVFISGQDTDRQPTFCSPPPPTLDAAANACNANLRFQQIQPCCFPIGLGSVLTLCLGTEASCASRRLVSAPWNPIKRSSHMCPEASLPLLSRTRSDDAVNPSNSTATFSLLSPPASPRLHKHSASLSFTPLISLISYCRPSTALSDDPFSTAEWFTRSETPRAHKTLAGLSAPPTPSSSRTRCLPRMIRASSPPSRPTSPFHNGDFIPRPPSRSEHLLRDTLRRAEEYERKHGGEIHRGRPRPTHDSYFAPMANTDLNDQEEDLNARRLGSYVFRSPGGAPSSPRPVRAASSRPRSPDPRYIPYGTPASPSPMPPMIPRTKTAPTMTSGVVPSNQHLVEPQPSSPLASSSSQSRVPQRRMSHRSHPSSHSNSADHSPLMRSVPLSPVSPHEVALRSKVEGLLKNAVDAFENREQAHKSALESRRHRRSKSYSHAATHTLSIVPDVPSIPRSPGSHTVSYNFQMLLCDSCLFHRL